MLDQGIFADTRVGLPQINPMLPGQPHQFLSRPVHAVPQLYQLVLRVYDLIQP